MQRRFVVLSLAAMTAGAVALVACVDLFHSTSDLLDACQIDADTDGCVVTTEAGVADAAADAADGNVDLCSFTAAEARAKAEAACAWLGACETPLGQNRYATCVEHAILAYDCTANASLPVRGAALDFWTCMVNARDCASVHACAWGVDQPSCPDMASPPTVCDENPAHAPLLQRGQCPTDGAAPQPHAENCAAWGQTCSFDPSGNAYCSGSSTGFNESSCTSACSGTMLVACADGGDDNIGIDCKNYGEEQCVTTGGLPTCAPASTTPCPDAGSPSEVLCTTGFQYAVGCPDGKHEETIDCFALTEGNGKCVPTATPGSDVSRACTGPVACSFNDQCVGTMVESCDRGVIYAYPCVSPFTACKVVATANGDFPRAQCVAP
jgi:hypothetical protein